MILVDTSVWVDHLRRSSPALTAALEEGAAAVHPFVIGEIALGHLRKRAEVLDLMNALPLAPELSHGEILAFIDAHGLAGCGIGWIDAHLLAAARLAGWTLWTLDRALNRAAGRLHLS